MSRFPFFIELAGERGLIAGGGKVALRKAEKLLEFGCEITVIAPEVLPGFEREGVEIIRRAFEDTDITEDLRFVIAASDDPILNARIAAICKEKRILFNAATGDAEGMFIFPALYTQGQLTAGVTTSGASPSAARWVRDRIGESIPESFGAILDQLSETRAMILTDEADQDRREQVFKKMFAEAMKAGRPLTAEEIRRLL